MVEGWELRLTGARGPAQWHVRAAAFQTAPSPGTPAEAGAAPRWVDVHTGERFWSARETRDFFTRLVYSSLNAFTTAASAVLVFLLARGFGYRAGTGVVVALGYGLGTMAWPYAKLDFSEPAATLFVLAAVWALYRAFPPCGSGCRSAVWGRESQVSGGRSQAPLPGAGELTHHSPLAGALRACRGGPRHPVWYGLLAAGALLLAIAGKYTAALFALAVTGQWACSSRWWEPARRGPALRFLIALVLPVGALGALAVGLALAFTGKTPIVLTSGTGRLWEDWLALPLWTGLRGLLLSPGKGLPLYSPWLLLALPGTVLFARRHRLDSLIVTLFPALVILLYGMKLGWHGGSWGPRYLLPVIPLLSLAAAPAVEWCLRRGGRWAAALGALAALSAGVQVLAIGKDPERYPAMVREFVVPALPDHGSHLGGRDYWIARGGPGLGRALESAGAGGGRRGLGYLWGYPDADLLVEVREPRRFTLSLYFVDWDRQGRRQTVQVEDATGTRLWALDRDFGDGVWASWEAMATPERPLRVSLQQRARDTAVVSAVTFDPPAGATVQAGPAPGQGASSAEPRLDWRTRGDWRGSYGAEGYVLFAWHSFNLDVASLPGYASGYELRHVGDKPDPRIHVEISEADVLDTPLLYALPFSPLLGNAWLLAADVAQLVFPARPDISLAVLARPPWSWFGVAAPALPRPQYGLGLDFWPTLLYTNYASHPSVLGGMWAVLLGVEALAIGAAAGLARGLAPASAGRRRALLTAGALSLVLVVYNVLVVRA